MRRLVEVLRICLLLVSVLMAKFQGQVRAAGIKQKGTFIDHPRIRLFILCIIYCVCQFEMLLIISSLTTKLLKNVQVTAGMVVS